MSVIMMQADTTLTVSNLVEPITGEATEVIESHVDVCVAVEGLKYFKGCDSKGLSIKILIPDEEETCL